LASHITFLPLNGFFHDTYKTPTLGFTVRPAFGNFNDVADASLIMLIVDADFCSAFYVLAVFRMLDLEVNDNLNALIATVAYHRTRQSF
jgi:hypothetical protein